MAVQSYIQKIVKQVASQGKPSSISQIIERTEQAVKDIVPSQYRLATRMELRKVAKQFSKFANNI
jgi:hypothetical protein